ncbi:DUF4846 domain-containing protein [Paraflavitalea pollutisoli]|uniref:DUF4846 domain-containing protein n=1 Tax=Paraflavitalea pollutisoli TaxID=3034143 RepID=UPI0023EC13D5|nr:DUF4846 domain-containing protein [Paraflavitalea sp. H1-2-19X]
MPTDEKATPVEAVGTVVPGLDALQKVGDIALPAGYKRIDGGDTAFARWLRRVELKSDTKVYLYDGRLKYNQSAQYAVLDIPIGNKDLQQCADAVMRLRAEFFYGQRKYDRIWFADNNGKKYACPAGADRARFEKYLETVYAWCGTLSLEKQLKKVQVFGAIQPGDVLIKGGSPGHAVIVMDVAANAAGEKIYLLAQSYMPAQSIHILKNPMDGALSPWYRAGNESVIVTPEWNFTQQQLRRW